MADRDTPEGTVAGIAQAILLLLFVHPDVADIPVPRRWLAAWLEDLTTVLAHLRQAQ